MGAIKDAMMTAAEELRAQYRGMAAIERSYPWPRSVADDIYDARMTLAHAIAAVCPYGEPSVCREWFEQCAEDRCHDEELDRCACGHYLFQHLDAPGSRICLVANGGRVADICGRCESVTDWGRWTDRDRAPVDAPAAIG